MTLLALPPMPQNWEPTRATLHNYANAVGVVARTHATPHPKWWHISLKVRPTGFVTDAMPLLSGGTCALTMDLRTHEVVLDTSSGERRAISMAEGLTGSEFGRRLLDMIAEFGLVGEYVREKFESDEPREYSASDASSFFAALVSIEHNLEVHRRSLDGPVGPLQIWPHGFDVAFEWYGTKMVSHQEEGKTIEMPAQLNLGFYPAGRPYFYSNPWPFETAALIAKPLPDPAEWNTEGWEGSIMYYDDVLEAVDPAQTLADYASAVFEAAAPTLR